MTAQYLLHRTHKCSRRDHGLIHAAAGGMGHILCPWASISEPPRLVPSIPPEGRDRSKSRLSSRYQLLDRNFVAITRKITDGKGVDVVYELICKGNTASVVLFPCPCAGLCVQLTARRQALPIRSTSSEIWAFAVFIITCSALSHYISNRKRNRSRSTIPVRCRRTGGGSEQRCQNLSASGGLAACSEFIVRRNTTGLIVMRFHSSRRLVGETPSTALVMTFTIAKTEAPSPAQKGNIMSIIRHEF